MLYYIGPGIGAATIVIVIVVLIIVGLSLFVIMGSTIKRFFRKVRQFFSSK